MSLWRKNSRHLEVIEIFLFFILLTSLTSALRINEIELNPIDDCRDCTEWLELYSNTEINLEGYRIVDKAGKEFLLSGSFKGYLIVSNLSISLNNDNEKLYLYHETEKLEETPDLSDSKNDDKTWQYCSSWIFVISTKGKENNCEEENSNTNSNNDETKVDKAEETRTETEEDNNQNQKAVSITSSITKEDEKPEIIQLNSKTIKTNEITNYKSRTQYIKEYAIYGFSLFCVLIIIVLLIKRKTTEKFEEY